MSNETGDSPGVKDKLANKILKSITGQKTSVKNFLSRKAVEALQKSSSDNEKLKNYTVVLNDPKGDEKDLESLSRISFDVKTKKRKSIVRKYSIENPPDILIASAVKARERIHQLFINAGIPELEHDIHDIAFVSVNERINLENELKPLGGRNFENLRGVSNIFYGAPIVFIRNDITDLDQASEIFHEMLHFSGFQVIDASDELISNVRQGFGIMSRRSQYNPWILEEGVMAYESAKFREHLSKDPLFEEDAKKREEKIEQLDQMGVIKNGRIQLDNGMEAEPRYFSLRLKNNDISESDFTMPAESGFAGSLFELLLSKFTETEQQEFLNTIHRARINLKLIPKVANIIDMKWGKGTYSRILKCGGTYNAVWDLIHNLRNKEF